MTIVNRQTTLYIDIINILGVIMIIYKPFWDTLKKKGKSTYTLINDNHISSATINKLRHNQPITTTTINDLCTILDCSVEDIALFVPSKDDQLIR